MDESRIQEIENLHRMLGLAFVHGPWTYDASDPDKDVVKDANGAQVIECLHAAALPVCTFIAASYSAIPDLIAALREMTARAEAAEVVLALVENIDHMLSEDGNLNPCNQCGSTSPCEHDEYATLHTISLPTYTP